MTAEHAHEYLESKAHKLFAWMFMSLSLFGLTPILQMSQ